MDEYYTLQDAEERNLINDVKDYMVKHNTFWHQYDPKVDVEFFEIPAYIREIAEGEIEKDLIDLDLAGEELPF